jgi:tetratricopeptide (TPR) repeat protein
MKKKPSIILGLALFFFTAGTQGFAQNVTMPRLEPDPKAHEYFRLGRGSHGYSWTDLAEISLWASGDTSAANLKKITALTAALRDAPGLPSLGEEKAEYILTFMHKNLLKTYSSTQTRVDALFSNGRFNCVSSAVLYVILCESAGIKTSGVMTKDHAFVTVHSGGTDIDVETTNPYGFDPGNRKEFHDQFGKLTGFAYVPGRNYRDRQTIGQIELISLIMNNRMTELESRNLYVEAVPIAVDRYTLLSGNAQAAGDSTGSSDHLFIDPRKDFLDRLLNYGTSLLKAGKEEDCLRWVAAASARYPESRWQELILAAANNRIMKYVKANQITEAKNFLNNQKTFLSLSDYKQLDALLLETELLAAANKIRAVGDGNGVINAVEQALENGRINDKRAAEIRTYAVNKTAAVLCAAPARDWRAAIAYIENAIARFGADRELEQAMRAYRGNLAADYHNRFADAWNKKKFDEAERILSEGLAETPDDRRLLSDKETINKNRR